jgi:4-diphosphocytidyl-2-C-methyl-D-erythritol kinase
MSHRRRPPPRRKGPAAVERVPSGRAERAPAKVNLTLRVVGRRPDGYHDIESLVVFASVGDELMLTAGPRLALAVGGPTAGSSGAVTDNLVLKAARALAERVEGLKAGRFELSKRLPVAAGLGGGSADAAAALRLLARRNHLAFDDLRLHAAARATGADVPVCLDPRPRLMSGIGDVLSEPLELPPLASVLVNPRVAVPTKDVFGRLGALRVMRDAVVSEDRPPADRAALLSYLNDRPNDLEAPAIVLQPVVAEVLAALRRLKGCRLARMSGSGATCFAVFDSTKAAVAAARALRARHPAWWMRTATLG